MKYILIFAFSAGTAFAQTETCISIDNDLDRLACYDLAAGRTPVQEVVETENSWIIRIETSAMTDEKNVFMYAESKEDINCSTYKTPQPATLTVRCMENTTAVIYNAACHLTSSRYSSYGDITYRLDDSSANTTGFEASTNNRALGLWSGRKAIPFVKAMFGRNQMLMRVTPYSESAHTATFDISGLEDAIAPLREACHW